MSLHEEVKTEKKSSHGQAFAIGAGFIGTLALIAGIGGAAYASSAAARDQNRNLMEEEEDEMEQMSQAAREATNLKMRQEQQKILENPAENARLLLEGRRLAVRALGMGTLLAFGITGTASLAIWALCGAPRSMDEFRQSAGSHLPKLSKDDNAEKLNFKNLRELADYLEKQK